jgi:hypothetical protein
MRGSRRAAAGRPYIEDAARDVDGNKFDLSVTGLRSEEEQRERDKEQLAKV